MFRYVYIIISLLLLYVAYPYYSLYKIYDIVNSGDCEDIGDYVVWDSVEKEIISYASDNGIFSIKTHNKIIDSIIDKLVIPTITNNIVSPDLICKVVAVIIKENSEKNTGLTSIDGLLDSDTSDKKITYSAFFDKSAFRFKVQVNTMPTKDNEAGNRFIVILTPDEWVWKVTKVSSKVLKKTNKESNI